jgi:hypothetical protein
MKKLLFLVLIMSVTIVSYFKLDMELYYYGKSNNCFYATLPLNIKPEYWEYDRGNLGFVLLEEDETLIAKGSKYWGSDIVIMNVNKYGFNKEKLIALVTDTKNDKHYIVCSKNNNIYSKKTINVKVINANQKVNFNELKWIDINKNSIKKLEDIKNYILIFLLIIIFYSFYILKKNI